MPFGQIFNQGVRYIKVNRFDSGGLDRSDYLGQLTNLTITYDDLGPINYNIVTTQEQDTYFVYGIETQNQSTSSVNYEVLDYRFSASCVGPTTASVPPPNIENFVTITNYTESYDSLNYFNPGTGTYTFNNTPNIQIEATYSFKASVSTGIVGIEEAYVDFVLFGGTHGPFGKALDSVALDGITTSPTTFNGSFIVNPQIVSNFLGTFNDHVIEGDYIQTRIQNTSTSPGIISITDFRLFFTQSTTPNPATSSLVIFEPEFIDFEYNDYNAIYGNAEVPQFSFQFMDVDYTTNFTKPVNFDLIISGTADRAPVQDSNYTSEAWSNLRYNGVKSEAPDFNQLTTEGGLGFEPNVEQNQTFMAYFDGVGGTGPELIGQTAYNIKYLIDTNGAVSNPEPGVPSLYNLIDNFEPGKKAVVRLIGNDPSLTENPNDNSLTGIHNITYVGRIAPILITETGSNPGAYITTMSFDSGPTIPDVLNYRFKASLNSGEQLVTPNNFTSIQFPTTTLNTAGSNYNNTTNKYTFTNPGNTLIGNTRVKFRAKIAARPSVTNNINVIYYIIKNPGPTEEILATESATLVFAPNPVVTIFETPYLNFENSDEVQVLISNPNSSNARIMAGSEFTLIQEYAPEQETTSSYWSIGDYNANPTIITASIGLTNLYNVGYRQTQSFIVDTASIGSFNLIQTDFADLQIGDKIRFEYNENKRYNIAGVIPDGPGGRLCLKLDGQVPTGSVLDHFILYRVVNDGTYVILDVDKPVAGYSFSGIIQPEYVSQELTDNYNDIIQDLTQRNIIS